MSNLDQSAEVEQLVDRRIDTRRAMDYVQANQHVTPQGITLTLTDLFKILALIGALVTSWLTLNKQISDISVKQSVAEIQYSELKQTVAKLESKIDVDIANTEKQKAQLEGQLRDLDNSLTQIYQKITTKK